MDCRIRRATEDDGIGISRVILAALRETNARDYSIETITRVEHNFSPSAVLEFMGRREVFVALAGRHIVGTASREGHAIRSVFVLPEMQGQGIGRLLMAAVEEAARLAGINSLTVPATITAEAFYSRLGYRAVREAFHDDERTVIMERSL